MFFLQCSHVTSLQTFSLNCATLINHYCCEKYIVTFLDSFKLPIPHLNFNITTNSRSNDGPGSDFYIKILQKVETKALRFIINWSEKKVLSNFVGSLTPCPSRNTVRNFIKSQQHFYSFSPRALSKLKLGVIITTTFY